MSEVRREVRGWGVRDTVSGWEAPWTLPLSHPNPEMEGVGLRKGKRAKRQCAPF